MKYPFPKSNQKGQAVLLMVLILLGVVVAIMTVININNIVQSEIKLQTSADAAAMTAATWKARSLNEISALNSGIIGCFAIDVIMETKGKGKKALFDLLKAQALSYAILSKEIAVNSTWRAAEDAYLAAYLTASEGKRPKKLPDRFSNVFPEETYGAIVLTGDNGYPPDFGLAPFSVKGLLLKNADHTEFQKDDYDKLLENSDGIFWKFKHPKLAGFLKALDTKAQPIKLGASSFPEWQKDYAIRSVSWRRKPGKLYGFFLEKFIQNPGICFAQANVKCASGSNETALFVPEWKAYMEKYEYSEEALKFACRKASLTFWQGKEGYGKDLIKH